MSLPPAPDPAQIESGRKLFAGPCEFICGVAELSQLPALDLPEIALAGRSNVGKSSLINALTGRKTLARTSNTPGRTRQLNYFNLGGRLILVDMPGTGYAEVSKSEKKSWGRLITAYLSGRPALRCVLLLVDSRHGLKPSDLELMSVLDRAAVSYRVVLTKTDKTRTEALQAITTATESALKRHLAGFPHLSPTSAHTGAGIDDLRAVMASYADVLKG